MEVNRGPVLEVGLLDGVRVMWMVGRAEEETEDVTRGETEELTGVEAAVGETEADGGDAVGLVNGKEWETELGVGVYCRVDATDLEAGVRVDVIDEDGKDAEEGRKEIVRPVLGGKGVDDVTKGEWGIFVREAELDGKLVGRGKAVVKDEEEGVMVEL